ncbi:hypothetical protein [Agrococcus casei]|uniref:hypothetical protein n=1 Tax=Agrococcus casei TaxID=343512 RepID=UPI003F9200CD
MLATSLSSHASDADRTPVDANGWLPEGYSAALVTDRAGLREAGELYTRVFGYDDPTLSLNPHLLKSLASNGGTSVGVFDEAGIMIGYAYGFSGRDADAEYQFSQAAVVDARVQGQGIGNALKRLQARVAAEAGYTEMRWTFDPLLARNAHFNLDSLGATGIRFLPSYYGSAASDRLLVRWQLPAAERRERASAVPPPELAAADCGTAMAIGDDVWIAVPADPRRLRASDVDETELRASVATSLQSAFADDRLLISCVRVDEDTAAYRAVRQRGRHHD